MKKQSLFNRTLIGAGLAGLLISHTPMLRAEAEETEPAVVQQARNSLTIDQLEELYEWLEQFFGEDDDEESDEDDFEDDDFEDDEDFDEDDDEIEGDDFEDDEDLDEDEDESEIKDDEFEDGEDFYEEDFDEDEFEDDESDAEDEHCEFIDDESEDDSEEAGLEADDELEDENDLDDESEEGEDDFGCQTYGNFEPGAGFGYINPNPAADTTIFPVSQDDANRAARFLTQASFGGNYPLITQVANQGTDLWLEDQFLQPIGLTRPYTDYLVGRLEAADEQGGEAGVDAFFEEQGIPEDYFGYVWWTQGITSPDLVRQRVATALTEIFVIGRTVEEIGENPTALSTFYDILLTNAFGNFKDILLDVTMNPSMGLYLSHFENAKADPAKGTFPDENYAREVMQLFSIGLFELNNDGTLKLDDNGQPIPTYSNDDIREFAKVFTGLGNGGEDPSFNSEFESDLDLSVPMAMYESYHDNTEKRLLNGTVLPVGQSGLQDIQAAVDNLFNHPNVGPFIGRLLIQRLVTSNPSPAYVERVASAFNGDGGTPRGDMKATLRAILLDSEATNPPQLAGNSQGKLREPMLRAMHLMRAFNVTSHDRTFNGNGYTLLESTKQFIFASPSVFNFFQPDYSPLGELSQNNLVAPEFQITSASSIIGVKNYLSFALSEDGPMDEALGSSFAQLDLTPELGLTDEELLNRLDTKLTYGTLTATTRAAVAEAISGLDGEEKVRTAIFLIMISPDYTTAI